MSEEQFDQIMYQFLFEKGLIIPITDEEIEHFINKSDFVKLPKELENSKFILDKLKEQ